jgi:hypothetical protein
MKHSLASDRLTKVNFNNYEDWLTYPTSDYKCDNCDETVSISLSDFDKHQRSTFTNLKQQDSLAVEYYVSKITLEKANSFLDFYCPGCKRPVRIYYDSWAGGRHTETGYILKYVID